MQAIIKKKQRRWASCFVIIDLSRTNKKLFERVNDALKYNIM